jgi:glycosyltransferase involved in cell wall biosynthesis
MNAAACSALRHVDHVHYAGPIDPAAISWQKALSKMRRLTGLPGDFSFFSRRRLEMIAHQVQARSLVEARLDFFHGFTPWILTKPRRPYIAWSDCTFRDYIEIFHRRRQFRREDLERIERAEAAWLKNAHRVLFTSQWAVERAINDYGLAASRVASTGIFGEVDMPTRDAYAGGKEFAFISTNFEAKGGRIVLAAFRQVKERHPDSALIVIGDRPSDSAAESGVAFAGFLRKETPNEYGQFQQILGRVRALVNATRCDTAPVLLIEAGYCGCPVISSRAFAIPELVDDGRTGLLLNDASDVDAVARAMRWMLEHDHEYRDMRQAAWTTAREQHSRRRFEERLLSHVREAVSGEGAPAA